jgi:hypothetical protein
MNRHLAAIAVVLCVTPAPLYAEETHFTVTIAGADVYKAPSTGSAVIGKASSGAVLTVTRELGSWVRVAWPAAQDGAGYLNVSWGRVSTGPLPASNPVASPRGASVASRTSITSVAGRRASTPTATTTTTSAATFPLEDGPTGARQAVSATAQSINALSPGTPTAHLVGLGGRMGSTFGYGVSARAAAARRLGVQLEVSRYSPTSVVGHDRLTSVQIAPSVLYSLPDKLTDYLWVRPYVGAGLTFDRSTLSSATPGLASLNDNGIGRQLFGGTAVAFASVPRFTLSVDYGYRWHQTPLASLAGIELAKRGLSVSGHWYVR